MANCIVPCDSLNKYYSDYKASKQADSCLGNLVCAKARFVDYVKNRLGVPVTYTQLLSLYANCGIEINPLATTTAKLLCGRTEPVFPPTVVEQHSPCDDSTSFATWKGTLLYENYRDSLLGSFDDKYIAKCLKARYIENFTVTQDISEFHYTLYYYDQAGNLLKTVPPAGVDLSKFGVSNWSDQVKTARANKTVLTPSHTLVTNYRYNTLNQVVAQNSPDGGTSEFWYDRLGRLAISRNAKQKADTVTSLYSYTKYDYLGRISEVGQIKNTVLADTMKDATSRNLSLLTTWLDNRNNLRGQITQTIYDLPYTGFTGIGDNRLYVSQRNLRNRVSYVTYNDTGSTGAYNSATFYTYDIHGNVDTLLQDYGVSGVYPNMMNKNGNGNRWKKIAYKYDLISGKVNMVLYQPGWGDQWLHRYSYDAENRLTLVETSRDSLVWERDARYEYYRHGPLARMIIGDQLVQGVDYAYTLQGWLKGVNSTGATTTHDMGGDGRNSGDVLNRYTARDAYSYSLNYFAGDYTPVNTGVNPFPGSSAYLNTAYRPLYNGNISSMVSNIRKMSDPSMVGGPILLYNYRYDQLNRLTAMDSYNGWVEAGNSWTGSSAALLSFNERISYDGNGNILKYLRNANTYTSGPLMDSLTYKYYAGTNKLRRVTDRNSSYDGEWGANTWDYNIDLNHQTDTSNYKYDAIGNLISDVQEGITSIKWSVYGKILEINRTATAQNPVTKIVYRYDPQGNRIGKIVSKTGTAVRDHTWYVRDAQGNILSTYTATGNAADTLLQNLVINQTEKYIYGSSRLGVYTWYEPVDGAPYDMQYFNFASSTYKRGWRQYELTNHLGNVLVTVSDKKFGVALPSSSLIDYYEPDVVAAQDYYPFGMLMPRRSFSSASAYKFGFNGQEMSNEIKGLGNSYTAEFWEYDSRIGRRWNLDPRPVIGLSGYSVFMNNPVLLNDPLGDTAVIQAGGGQGVELDEKANTLEFYENKRYHISGTSTQVPVESGQLRSFTNFLGRFSATWTEKDGVATFVGYKNDKGQTIDEAILQFRRNYALANINIGRDFMNFVYSTYEKSQEDPVGYVNDLMITHFTLYTPGTGGIIGRSRNVSTTSTELLSSLGILKFVNVTRGGGPIVGGGAKLEYLGNNVGRIQSIATKYNLEIAVVGSRAKGTANGFSDWDYIITGGTPKARSSALFQLPRNLRALKDGMPRSGSEVLKGVKVDPNLPHIIFKPTY